MGWKRVTFSADDMTAGKASKLEHEFKVRKSEHGDPPGAVMYDTDRSSRGVNCYFTPKAVEIAFTLLEQWGAEDCEEPNVGQLNALV